LLEMSPRPTALLQHSSRTEIAPMLLTADDTAWCTGKSYRMTQRLAYAPVRQISRAPIAAKHSASSGTSNLESAPNSATSRKSAQRSVIDITARQATRIIRMIFTLHYVENMPHGMAWDTLLHTTSRKIDDSSDLQIKGDFERLYFKDHPGTARTHRQMLASFNHLANSTPPALQLAYHPMIGTSDVVRVYVGSDLHEGGGSHFPKKCRVLCQVEQQIVLNNHKRSRRTYEGSTVH